MGSELIKVHQLCVMCVCVCIYICRCVEERDGVVVMVEGGGLGWRQRVIDQYHHLTRY